MKYRHRYCPGCTRLERSRVLRVERQMRLVDRRLWRNLHGIQGWKRRQARAASGILPDDDRRW